MPSRVRTPALSNVEAEIVQKAVAAFRKGTRCLMLSRLQAGMYCHEFYVARLAAGDTNRVATTRYLAAQLAPWADSQRDGDPNTLARFWRVAHVLGNLSGEDVAAGGAGLVDGLSVGKLDALSPLVIRPEGTEEGRPFSDDPAKQEAAKTLWRLAIDGEAHVKPKELARRVALLRDEAGEGAGDVDPIEVATMPLPAEGDNPSDERGRVTGNLLNPETPYTAKDAAELAVGILAKSDAADAALEALLRAVVKDTTFGTKARLLASRTVQLLAASDKSNPLELAKQLTDAGSAPRATAAAS